MLYVQEKEQNYSVLLRQMIHGRMGTSAILAKVYMPKPKKSNFKKNSGRTVMIREKMLPLFYKKIPNKQKNLLA